MMTGFWPEQLGPGSRAGPAGGRAVTASAGKGRQAVVRVPDGAAQSQPLPFSVKADGEVLLLVKLPVKPTVTVPAGEIEGL